MTQIRPLLVVFTACLSLGAFACSSDTTGGGGSGAAAGAGGDVGEGGDGGGGAGGGAGGSAPSIPTFNGCAAADYVDLSGAAADRTIAVGRDGLVYTPKCATIAAGQTLTFQGSFPVHPTAPGNAADPNAGDYDGESPIVVTSSGTTVDFTFPDPGTYPFYCQMHGFGDGMGMSGSVHVE